MHDAAYMISTVDYHTGGEPFRIVTGGLDPIAGTTMLQRRQHAMTELDDVRRLLVNEPRGHAGMYGALVTEPVDAGADLGVLFFHNAGFSTACGHGTIALVTWALESDVVTAQEPETTVVVDTPSGRLVTVAHVEGRRVRSVRFRNIPAFVHARGVPVALGGRRVIVDIAFGGAFYACLDAAAVGCTVTREDLPALVTAGRRIKDALNSAHEIVHPLEDGLRDIYGVIFVQDEFQPGALDSGPSPARRAALRQRNVTVFADGQVDRSPCGSGTSARLALLHEAGLLPPGALLEHRGIVNSVFLGSVVDETEVAGKPAVVTEIAGSAYLTGIHRFLLRGDDPMGTGFLLR